MIAWGVPILIWAACTVGARGFLARLGLIRCRVGDWGTAFLAGFTLFTALVYAAAAAGVRIGGPLFVAVAAVLLAAGLLAGRGARPRDPAPEAPWTPAEWVMLAVVVFFLATVCMNAVYFPVLATDAHSYDGRARFLIHDGTLDLDLYHWPGMVVHGRSNITYPPLYSLALAVGYAFGGWQSKIVLAFFDVAWLLVVYGVLRGRLPRFWALAWVLFLGLTPEVYSHASYALLNLPAMALIAGAAASLARFTFRGGRGFLLLAGVLGAGAAGVRADAVPVFLCLVLVTAAALLLRERGWTRRVMFLVPVAAAPLLTWGTWTLYLEFVIGAASLAPVGGGAPIGPGKVLYATRIIMTTVAAFGLTFYVWFPSLLLSGLARDRTAWFYQAAAVATYLTLFVLFATLDASYGGGPAEVLGHSFKRALFYLVPLAGMGAAMTPPWSWLAARGKGWLHQGPPVRS